MSKHDAFVRRVLSDIKTARAFMQRFLPAIVDKLDLAQLALKSDQFVDEQLEKSATDLLFQVPWLDQREAYVAMLVEHKSEGAARASGEHLPLQLRCQECELLREHRRNHPTAPIPLVLLVALYHGSKPYKGPRTVGESMGLPSEWVPERWKNQDMLLIDLAELDESTLAPDKLGLFLRVLKHIYDENFLEIYEGLVPALQNLDNSVNDRGFVIALNRYLVTSANMENLAKFSEIAVKSFSEETGGAAMTLSEVLQRQERERVILNIVRNMLRQGFDFQTIASSTDLSVEDVELMAKKVS